MNIFEVFNSDNINTTELNSFFDTLLSSFSSWNSCKESIDQFFKAETFEGIKSIL
jgi:hypothetical protein